MTRRREFLLGTQYQTGRGVTANLSDATKWYRKAAEQGFPRAQNSTGVRHANGDDPHQNLDKAIRSFKLAADQGNAEAFGNLTALYAGAYHLPPNYREAYFWSVVAHHRAATNRPRIGCAFSPPTAPAASAARDAGADPPAKVAFQIFIRFLYTGPDPRKFLRLELLRVYSRIIFRGWLSPQRQLLQKSHE